MPENPTMYLNRITLTVLDDLYSEIKQAAVVNSTSMEELIIEYVRTGLGLGPSSRLSVEVLREKLTQEMKLYATDGFNAKGILTQSEDHSVFAVVYVGKTKDEHFGDAGLITRIVNRYIVIDCDQSDKPLVDALVQTACRAARSFLPT